ncbi:hypothetical protein [Aureimonas sp. AU12]|uniref:hypothetical protein n=1 Tax=Aureimonas sp. AU12 TaxID=1638161 RepID=UPI000781C18F|nr:hypothetical protein [Aureimonas sp. AU12]
MRVFTFTADEMAVLALRGVAAFTGRPVTDLAPFRFEMVPRDVGDPSFVVTVNTDRDPVPAAEFEPS